LVYKKFKLVSDVYFSVYYSFVSESGMEDLFFSTIINKNILDVLDRLKPVKWVGVYEHFFNDRKKLYKQFKEDFKGKIYIIVNKLNGKIYVGSTRSLKIRLQNHFNLSNKLAETGRPLSKAIIKYGLVNFAFIIVEEVDLDLHNLEDRETYWIRKLKPEYNATKDVARNVGALHSDETKLVISKKRSSGPVYIYDEFKQLLAIAPSLISIAVLLGSKSISISLNRAISEKSLFRSS
jgi:hypothetical protein